MADRLHPDVVAAHGNVARLLDRRGELLRAAAARGRVDLPELTALDREIGGLLDAVLELTDPCDASASEPLVLLPTRLETRFGTCGGQTTLRVRIFPDDIHVDDLVRGLTDEETAAGRAYWTSVWSDPVPEDAWPALLEAAGAERAEWVAHATAPVNLSERGTGVAPSFPEPLPRGPRNVVARALPERFVVLAIQGDQVSRAAGRPVPPDLQISPIALEGDEMERARDSLDVPPGSEWLVDYDLAVEVGMAVTITLTGGNAPVDRVIALGTRASLDARAGAAELEDLLAGHRFGAAGLGLLAQGTPTNNADAERSPYRPRRGPSQPPVTAPAAAPGSDTERLAEVLGVDAALLSGLVGGGSGEQALARAVNTALWAPGWGEFLSRLDERDVPGVTDAQRESARGLFRDHVRGRGPAPAIRVGAQPYGVLPVSDLDAWQPRAGETAAGIAQVVRRLLMRWRVAAALNVPRIRPGAADLDETLLEILGSSPVMQGLRVRPLISDDVADAVIASVGANPGGYAAESIAVAAVASQLLGAEAPKIKIGSLHQKTRPLPLPLASARDPEFITALLGGTRTPEVDSVLQALVALAWNSSELDVAKAAPATVLPNLLELLELEPGLKARATAVVTRADSAAPEELHEIVGELVEAGVDIGGPTMLRRFQPIEQVQTSLAEVALSAPVGEQSRSIAASAFAGWIFAMGYRNEVRAAMQSIAGTEVAARALAVAEALDCSSHRLDAWATAVVAERRSNDVAGRGRGLTIGAYGVVENLRPQAGPTADGWIYAPSTRHATAAGMLRSSQLSHVRAAAAAGDGGPFAIDLSSRRIQSAHHVIDGVRQGQQLGALIGYQIERGLAAAGLARLQLSLRAIAPSVQLKLHVADGDTQAAQESIAARNVVDGVLLLKRHPPGDVALRTRLRAEPENAYLEPGDWEPLTDAEWAAVSEIMRKAADTIDAVADIMLSESVLQFAGGNPHRAAAAMDAMGTGASPSDTIDVLEAQDSGERLTHRVLAVVGGAPPPSGWNRGRPRARVEPRLEAWAAAHLGDPEKIVVAEAGGERITLAQSGMAALDLVFATDLVALERALRVAIPALGDAPLAVRREPGWPAPLRALGQVAGLATALRSTIAGATPLLPAELARPGERPARELEAALPELTGRAATLAASLTAAVAALGPTVAAIPTDGIVADEAAADALTQAIHALEPFGIPLESDPERPLDVSWVPLAWETAQARAIACQAAVAQIGLPSDETPPNLVLDAVQEAVGTVFGDGFLVVPLLAPGSVADGFAVALEDPSFAAPPASAVRRFVRDVGTVRVQMTRLSEALLLGRALGNPRTLRVAQLSERVDGAPAPGTTHWLAGPLPADGPWPTAPVAHVVLDEVGAASAATPLAGLVIDAWVEDLPAQVGPKADPDDTRPGRARTALAVRSNAASSRPPQAVLCAVSPDGERWTTDSLRAVVEQTLELARVRMVTLERMIGDGLVLPALYTRSSSLQGSKRPLLHFENLATVATEVPMKFVKEMGT